MFDWLDGNGPEVRRLVGYYGSQAVGDALTRCNPDEVPAMLGDVEGFRRHCERYTDDGASAAAAPAPPPAESFAAKFLALRAKSNPPQ